MKKNLLWISVIVTLYTLYLIIYTGKACVPLENATLNYDLVNGVIKYTRYGIAIAALLYTIAMWISVCKGQIQICTIFKNWGSLNLLFILLGFMFAIGQMQLCGEIHIEILYPVGGVNVLILLLIICVWFRNHQVKSH